MVSKYFYTILRVTLFEVTLCEGILGIIYRGIFNGSQESNPIPFVEFIYTQTLPKVDACCSCKTMTKMIILNKK